MAHLLMDDEDAVHESDDLGSGSESDEQAALTGSTPGSKPAKGSGGAGVPEHGRKGKPAPKGAATKRGPKEQGSGKGGQPDGPKSKAGRQAGKGRRYCRGCGSFKPCAEFPLGHSLCAKDKRAVDNLSRMAKRQGQSVWFGKIIHNEYRL